MERIYGVAIQGAKQKNFVNGQNATNKPKAEIEKVDQLTISAQKNPMESNLVYQNEKHDSAKIWKHLLEQCQQTLQKECEGIVLTVVGDEAKDLPACPEGQVQILIRQGFLERMTAAQEAYIEGRDFIKELWQQLEDLQKDFIQKLGASAGIQGIIDEEGQVQLQFWAAGNPSFSQTDPRDAFTKALQEGKMVTYYKEKGGRNVTEIKTPDGTIRLVITKRLGYRPGKDLSRLAQAVNENNVKTIAAGVQAMMRRVKNDRFLDEDEVRQALVSMQSVVRRAKTKVAQLHREEVLERQAHQAAKKGEQERALEMARQLKRKRTARIIKEYNQIRQHSPDFYNGKHVNGYGTVTSMSMETDLTTTV